MHAIQVDHVVKRYKNGVQALNGLSLSVKEGEIFSLLGQNGAGKSTLIRILTTYLCPTAGEIEMMGKDIKKDAAVIRSQIACVAQQTSICKSFFSKVLKLLAFQGVWMFLYSRFPLFFPLSGKNKGKSYCTLSSSFAASRLASLLACA